MALTFPFKDPNERLDYTIDWADRLEVGDIIVDSSWEFYGVNDDVLLMDEESFTDETTTIWLSGGTLATTYYMTNRVITAASRIMDQSAKIKIKAK